MKVRVMFSILVLALLVVVPSSVTLGQAASVTWNLIPTDSLNTSTIVGNVTGQPASGVVTVADSFVVRSYGGTVGGAAGPLGNYCRWNPGAGVSWGPETAMVATHYVQFVAAPATGNKFTIDSVAFWTAGGGTGSMRMFAFYSKDPTFATKTRLTPTGGTTGDTVMLLNSGTLGNDRRYAFAVGATINNAENFYLRIYPWYTGAASTSKYFYTQAMVIKGSTTSSTGVDRGENGLPSQYALDQNFPNPFNPSTVIGYEMPKSSSVNITVYDILGNEVRQLVNGVQSAGYHSVTFNSQNLASGMYFYKIQTGTFTQTKKMILLK